ncbi:hypothetical protein ACP70R_039597 [Stipagrostis hirtigluma subsp. patula]
MKLSAILSAAVCVLVVVLNASCVESRTSGMFHWYTLFVFGDSFADSGNLPKDKPSDATRTWYSPYGSSDSLHYGRATGRFSNGLVESDFIGKFLGRFEAPPTYVKRPKNYVEMAGMNLAFGGAGVFEVPHKVPTLGKQVGYFKKLIKDGILNPRMLRESVALVAISGNDYARLAKMTGTTEMIEFVGNVTTEIAKQVKILQSLKVTKILVNTMHPLGCTPWLARPQNYTACDARGNMGASLHNGNLKKKLGGKKNKNVMLVDLNAAFNSFVNPSDSVTDQFEHKLEPCCESSDPNGYCGQVDENGDEAYSVCDDPDSYFYWDDVHPTQAGWKAVMDKLEGPIKDFLDISHN